VQHRSLDHVSLATPSLTTRRVSYTSTIQGSTCFIQYQSESSRLQKDALATPLRLSTAADRTKYPMDSVSFYTLASFAPIAVTLFLALSSSIQFWWLFPMCRLWSIPLLIDELTTRHGSPGQSLRISDYAFFDHIRLFAALPVVSMIVLPTRTPQNCKGLEDVSNPDIAGAGVRISTYVLLLTVFVSLFLGSFHGGPSGTKELGIATFISTCNLAKCSGERCLYHTDHAQICYH
jgi:hypothetical protein